MYRPAINFAALTLLALSGCATPQGQQGSARIGTMPTPVRVGFMPTKIQVVEKDNVSSFCIDNRATLGCVVRLRETNQCIVFVKSGLSHEVHGHVVTSETKRCMESA